MRKDKMKYKRNRYDKSTLRERFEVYLLCANDGKGNDITTGQPLKTFEQWIKS